MLTSLARIRLNSAVPLSSYGTPSEALPGPPNSDLLTSLFSAGFSFDPPSYFCKSFTYHTYETCPFASSVSPLEPILTEIRSHNPFRMNTYGKWGEGGATTDRKSVV